MRSRKMSTASSEEVWKPIPNYEGLYEVSDFGRVRSLPKSVVDPNGRIRNYPLRVLRQQATNKYGHLKVGLYKNEKCREFLVHRLVLMAFVGNPSDAAPECLHGDGDPTNNVLQNLRWGSSKENSMDCEVHGKIAREFLLPQTKLSDLQVIEILNDPRSSPKIAADYGVCARHVRRIKSGDVRTNATKPKYKED